MMFINEKEYGLLADEPLEVGDVFYQNGFERVKEFVTENHTLLHCLVLRKGYVPKPKTVETEELQVGDVVVLKSSGPKMTVERIENDSVTCSWFSSDCREVFEAEFHIKALVKQGQNNV